MGVTFSPDSRYVLCTMDTRPLMGESNIKLGSIAPLIQRAPSSCETFLADLKTGRRVWRLRGDNPAMADYAVHSAFGAVARDGSVAAFYDYYGLACLVDKTGKILFQQSSGFDKGVVVDDAGKMILDMPKWMLQKAFNTSREDVRLGPRTGVGVWMDPEGRTALFGLRPKLLIVHDRKLTATIEKGDLHSACVTRDGQTAIAAYRDGRVVAFTPQGTQKWSMDLGGPALLAACGMEGVLVAATGKLMRLNAMGKPVYTLDLARTASGAFTPPTPRKVVRAPSSASDPGSLDYARKHLNARQLAVWKPRANGSRRFNRTFYSIARSISLKKADAREAFVHLVYRRPENNQSLIITTQGKDGEEQFDLDLPTPVYRVIDIPVRGPNIEVTLKTEGPAEVAEMSLWSLTWPGPNVAWVKSAKEMSSWTMTTDNLDEEEDDALDVLDLGGLEGEGDGLAGKMKDCSALKFVTEIIGVEDEAQRGNERVIWKYDTAGLQPLDIVDGKRFGNGTLKPLTEGDLVSFRGGCWFAAFPSPIKPALVAVYDRAAKQSDLAKNIAVFSGFSHDRRGSKPGITLGGVVCNDQFWRLIPLYRKESVQQIGVLVYAGEDRPEGLSEVEVYQ